MYLALKTIHMATAFATVALFAWRWQLALSNSALLKRRWLKIVPHINDTVLLVAALGLAFLSGQYPFVAPWLTAKFFGLLAYIALGMVALKSWRTSLKIAAGIIALLAVGYIISVAFSKDPRGFFLFL